MCKKNEHVTYELWRHAATIRTFDCLDDIEPMSAEQIYMEARMHDSNPERLYYTDSQSDAEFWVRRRHAELLPWVAVWHGERGYLLRACVYTLDLYDDGEYQYTIDIKAESWGE